MDKEDIGVESLRKKGEVKGYGGRGKRKWIRRWRQEDSVRKSGNTRVNGDSGSEKEDNGGSCRKFS